MEQSSRVMRDSSGPAILTISVGLQQ